MNPNLPRWIFASLNGHFDSVASGLSVRFHVEGVDEDEALDFTSDNILFRLNGPFADIGIGLEIYRVETQILLTDIIETTGGNPYDIYVWAGKYQEAMLEAIPIYRRGNGAEDDDSLIGCLNPDFRRKDPIRVVSYGEVDRDARIKQVSVNGLHILEI